MTWTRQATTMLGSCSKWTFSYTQNLNSNEKENRRLKNVKNWLKTRITVVGGFISRGFIRTQCGRDYLNNEAELLSSINWIILIWINAPSFEELRRTWIAKKKNSQLKFKRIDCSQSLSLFTSLRFIADSFSSSSSTLSAQFLSHFKEIYESRESAREKSASSYIVLTCGEMCWQISKEVVRKLMREKSSTFFSQERIYGTKQRDTRALS
jgi:hypothetical protein